LKAQLKCDNNDLVSKLQERKLCERHGPDDDIKVDLVVVEHDVVGLIHAFLA
jgi:hypothetical protein